MRAGVAEAECLHGGGERRPGHVIHRELQKPHPAQHGRRGQRHRRVGAGFGQDQRAQPVPRNHAGRRGTEMVVEHLQRQRPLVPARQHGTHEPVHVQIALARKAAVVARPAQHVHLQPRRIGQLHEEQLVHLRDPGRVVAQSQRMEAVDDEAERRVIHRLYDPPRMRPALHMPAPAECLIPHAQSPGGGAFRHRPQVGTGPGVVVQRRHVRVAAHQHQIRTQRLHDVELAFCPVQVAGARRLRHRLEVAERLIEFDREAEVFGNPAHVGGRAVKAQQVTFHDLHTVEPDRRRGLKLVGQRAGQRYGRDAFAPGHASRVAMRRSASPYPSVPNPAMTPSARCDT